MSAYSGLPEPIAGIVGRLDDAISLEERLYGSGCTVLIIPANPQVAIFASIDGKPATADIKDVISHAFALRGEAEGR